MVAWDKGRENRDSFRKDSKVDHVCLSEASEHPGKSMTGKTNVGHELICCGRFQCLDLNLSFKLETH